MELDLKKFAQVLEKIEAEADQFLFARSQVLVCSTCGYHDPKESTWMILPGFDLFVVVPFHVVHTILEKDEEEMEFESKKLQSLVKEKALLISELGALADSISPGIIRSLVTLNDKSLVK